MYKCRFCGYSSDSSDDFEDDFVNQKGYWCPICDGFTYYDEKSDHQSYKLLFETKSHNNTVVHKKRVHFSTQVSPLRWPGGKSKVVSKILAHCNIKNMHNFVEPFAGGASVGLSLLLSGTVKQLYLNDLDFGVYSLFTTIKNNPEYLIRKIETFMPTSEEYLKSKQIILKNYADCSVEDAAWHLLVVNRLAFSGISKANCMSNPACRWNSKTLVKRINNIARFSDHIQVYNLDACELIEELYWKPDTTIFIDPPYVVKGKDLYMEYYRKEDHEQLAFLLENLYKGMPGADLLITYDECEYLKELYNFPDIEELERQYCIAN